MSERGGAIQRRPMVVGDLPAATWLRTEAEGGKSERWRAKPSGPFSTRRVGSLAADRRGKWTCFSRARSFGVSKPS